MNQDFNTSNSFQIKIDTTVTSQPMDGREKHLAFGRIQATQPIVASPADVYDYLCDGTSVLPAVNDSQSLFAIDLIDSSDSNAFNRVIVTLASLGISAFASIILEKEEYASPIIRLLFATAEPIIGAKDIAKFKAILRGIATENGIQCSVPRLIDAAPVYGSSFFEEFRVNSERVLMLYGPNYKKYLITNHSCEVRYPTRWYR